MTAFLAYRPFVDPLELHRYWFLFIIPMAFFIALAYKAVRIEHLRALPRQVAVMTIQIVLGMIALGAASYLFIQVLVPMLAPK